MAVAWSAELCRDLWVHQQHRAMVALVALGCLAWCFQMGRLWRVWSSVEAPLRLHWTGDTSDLPHWRVIEWGQGVTIRVACDFQSWLLLDVKSVPVDGLPARSVWAWVPGVDGDASEMGSSCATAHRLRALLYQARGERADEGRLDALPERRNSTGLSLASSGRTTFPGSNLVRSVLNRYRGRSLNPSSPSGRQDEPWAATEFQPTQWLPRSESLDDIPPVVQARCEGGR